MLLLTPVIYENSTWCLILENGQEELSHYPKRTKCLDPFLISQWLIRNWRQYCKALLYSSFLCQLGFNEGENILANNVYLFKFVLNIWTHHLEIFIVLTSFLMVKEILSSKYNYMSEMFTNKNLTKGHGLLSSRCLCQFL